MQWGGEGCRAGSSSKGWPRSAKSARDRERELLESDPVFRKACARLDISTKIDKPPKTSGARRKQQRIYEVTHARTRAHTNAHTYTQIGTRTHTRARKHRGELCLYWGRRDGGTGGGPESCDQRYSFQSPQSHTPIRHTHSPTSSTCTHPPEHIHTHTHAHARTLGTAAAHRAPEATPPSET